MFIHTHTLIHTNPHFIGRVEGAVVEATAAGNTNQKFGLLHAMLGLGYWDGCKVLFSQYPAFATLGYPPIRRRLCRMLLASVQPLYRKHAPVTSSLKAAWPGVAQCEDDADFVARIIPMLQYLGPYISSNMVLLTTVVRLCREVLARSLRSKDVAAQQVRFSLISMSWKTTLKPLLLPQCATSMVSALPSFYFSFAPTGNRGATGDVHSSGTLYH